MIFSVDFRRIFIHYFDNQGGHLRPAAKGDTSSSSSQFRNWFLQQYRVFIDELKGHICSSSDENVTPTSNEVQLQIVAIRTMLEVCSSSTAFYVIVISILFPVFVLYFTRLYLFLCSLSRENIFFNLAAKKL